MIRIDSITTQTLSQNNSNNRENKQMDFAALLMEEAAKTATQSKETLEQDKSASGLDLSQAEQVVEQNAREELLRILQMSPAERIRYQMLQEMGLTEEALAAMPFEERMKIEAMIEEEIERQLAGGSKGPEGIQEIAQQGTTL
ncbi:hypothetical protein [Marinobacterium stanieri]|uniref:hypothetical protein n=1 Tax=Marinobacterium stanieri TaxID=49186 RepID=UPI003A936012